jgi:hypothetical protein
VNSGALGDEQRLVAIEIGIGRATPWFGIVSATGGNWARDNATWHPAPAP